MSICLISNYFDLILSSIHHLFALLSKKVYIATYNIDLHDFTTILYIYIYIIIYKIVYVSESTVVLSM